MSLKAKLASFDDDIDFPKLWRIGYVVGAVLIVLSLVGIVGRGLNLGIDFEGGTSWDVPGADLSVDEARDAVASTGETAAKVQTVGRGGSSIVRVQSSSSSEAVQAEVSAALAAAAGIDVEDISVSTVGPSWGDQVSEKAQRALVVFFILITIYMAVRLEWKMAIGALAAVVHDLLISVGVYALFQFEITPATVIAFLTILGYSLYDTIVVFDRMQENAARVTSTSKVTYTGLVSLSLNQVLMRSINTTVTSLLPVLSLLVIGSFVLGAVALQEFALALAVGLVLGGWSSIMVAAPVVALIKEREPRFRELRERAEARRGPVDEPIRATAGRTSEVGTPGPTVDRTAPPPLSGRPIPPRPRKKGKRR
ncbi:MAG: protein translocase subunit SecF [Acidimicrobiales bacterium]